MSRCYVWAGLDSMCYLSWMVFTSKPRDFSALSDAKYLIKIKTPFLRSFGFQPLAIWLGLLRTVTKADHSSV